jgi:hypothetical protein
MTVKTAGGTARVDRGEEKRGGGKGSRGSEDVFCSISLGKLLHRRLQASRGPLVCDWIIRRGIPQNLQGVFSWSARLHMIGYIGVVYLKICKALLAPQVVTDSKTKPIMRAVHVEECTNIDIERRRENESYKDAHKAREGAITIVTLCTRELRCVEA